MKQSKKLKRSNSSAKTCFLSALLLNELFKKKKLQVLIVVLFALLFVLRIGYYTNLSTDWMYPDSYTYDSASTSSFFHGQIDEMRTPVYPAIIDFFQLFSAEKRFVLTIRFQQIVSFISVIFFYRILKLFNKSSGVCLFITILYGLFPPILGYDKLVLTESLSLSLIIFVCYYVFRYLKERKLSTAILISILVIISVFLRPAFVYLITAWSGFLFVQLFNKNLSRRAAHFLVGLVPAMLAICYCFGFYQQYGVFTFCSPSVHNTFGLVQSRGYYEEIPEHVISKTIKEDDSIRYDSIELLFTLAEIDSFNRLAFSKNHQNQLKDTANLAIETSRSAIESYALTNSTTKNLFYIPAEIYPTFKLGSLYFTAFISVLFFVYLLTKRSFSWYYSFLIAVIIAPIVITLLNSPGEYGRLMMISIPPAAIALFIVFSYFLKQLPVKKLSIRHYKAHMLK